MATKAKNTENRTFIHKITAKIAELLKLGEEGKVDAFLTKVTKMLKRDIQAYEQDKKSLKFEYEKQKDKLEDSLEDAKQELEESYLNIPVEKVSTNTGATSYVQVYISNIKAAQEKVARIERELKELNDSYKEELKSLNGKINELKEMLETIK